MSKHLVSKDTIDALVTAALTWGSLAPGEFWFRPVGTMSMRQVGRDHASVLGAMLWRQTWEAAEAWLDDIDLPDYEFEPYPGTPDPVVVLKTISYYEYQTETEPQIWDVSEAAGFTRFLRIEAVSRVDGWDAAFWGIDDRSAFSRG